MTHKPEPDLEIIDKDKQHKEKGKEYTDKKRLPEDSDNNMSVRDKVYIKNIMNLTNKLSLNYDRTHTR